VETEWDYSGRKERGEQKKKISKANERKRKVKRRNDEKVYGQGGKRGAPAPHGAKLQSSCQWFIKKSSGRPERDSERDTCSSSNGIRMRRRTIAILYICIQLRQFARTDFQLLHGQIRYTKTHTDRIQTISALPSTSK